MKKNKIAYIEGRPFGHPTHTAYANSVNSIFHHVDFRLRYHDTLNSSAIRRYLSWLLCAFTFPNRKKYDAFLSEEAYFMLGIMKKLGLISKRQKLLALMGSHTLYFLYSNKYSKSTKIAFIKLFNLYDAFICIGPIQYKLMTDFLGEHSKTKIYQIFNGIPEDKLQKLLLIKPNLEKLNILSIGAVPNEDRTHYKGVDLMLEAFSISKIEFPNLTYTIIGNYNPQLSSKLLEKHCPNFKKDVFFVGQTDNIFQYLKDASLYLHTARGEAWGLSVNEAMAAGVVPIVSDWTGAKIAVEKISTELVVKLESSKIAKQICWYLNLPLYEKENLSKLSKLTSKMYTEKEAIENFKATFNRALDELSSN